MSISERTHIRWFPDEATEPTSTLVLTAHNRQFVDLRLLKPAAPGPFATLEWGIGGRAVGTPSHGEWVHDIDSRTPYPDPAEPDEGDMYPHPTLPDVTLERGRMRHPDSGELREYEEGWRAVGVLPVAGEKKCSIVLETGPDAAGTGGTRRGLIVRVGQFCQAILRDGPSVVVERWGWSPGGGWRMLAQIGQAEVSLPCELTWSETPGPGDHHTKDGTTWVVREMCVW